MVPPIPAGPSSASSPLSSHAARGAVWVLIGSTIAKATSVCSQLVLAWLLDPEVFGLVAMALSASSLIAVLQELGLVELLVQRQRHFRRWASAAFWLGISVSSAAALLLLAVSPLVARLYGEPRIVGLIAVIALRLPLAALGWIAHARLIADLQFKTVTVANTAWSLLAAILSIAFAFMGLGPYAFVLPMAILALPQSIGWFLLAGQRISPRPHFDRWRFLWHDAGMLLGSRVLGAVQSQGDYVVLSIAHSASVVGIYFFAFNLSMQAIQLLAAGLVPVLMPVFTRIHHDKDRTLKAFLRASTSISCIVMPFCLAQAVLATPLLRLLYAVPR
mgnify:CR=1 FL=1